MKALTLALMLLPTLALAQSIPQPVSIDPVAKADKTWQQYISQRQTADAQVMVSMARQIDELANQVAILKAELAAKTAEAPK